MVHNNFGRSTPLFEKAPHCDPYVRECDFRPVSNPGNAVSAYSDRLVYYVRTPLGLLRLPTSSFEDIPIIGDSLW